MARAAITRSTVTAEEHANDRMFSHREVPWMKLGKITEQPKTAQEAAEAVGMNWNVDLVPAGWYDKAKKSWVRMDERRVIVRSDTRQWLGIASADYQTWQYSEAFEFMDTIDPTYVAAGTLRGGRQGFMVVRAPEHCAMDVLNGQDPHELYVVLRTSHDCTRAVEINLMALRGLCMNMMPLNSFGKHAVQRWSIPHFKSLPRKLAEAQSVLARIDSYVEDFNETAGKLAEIQIELDQSRSVLEDVLPDRPQRDRKIDEILGILDRPTNGFAGTGWGLINAVTEYHDWIRGGERRSDETRLVAGLSGVSRQTVNRTVARLLNR